MRTINTYINEKLRLTNKHTYTCQPKDKDELRKIILQRIDNEGPECDLNDIDTSKITDMYGLFDAFKNEIFKKFNGDISMWDVSNVRHMNSMFIECYEFDCDISLWNVSNVEDMEWMFYNCKNLSCDISQWNVSNVKDMHHMFRGCEKFDCNLSIWDVSNVENMAYMFWNCKTFKQDLNAWDVKNVRDMECTFKHCPTTPKWYDRKRWENKR